MKQQILYTGIEIDDLLNSVRTIVREEVVKLQEPPSGREKDEYSTPKEICLEFKISKPTFYEWIKKGKFCIYKIGNRSFVKRIEFIDAMHKVNRN